MRSNLRKQFFLCLLILTSQSTIAKIQGNYSSPERGFVSKVPATSWEMGLVSGNGKYGAMVFGQPLDETIVLNHAELYMPLHKPLPPVNTAAHLKEIRQLLADGEYQKAADFVVTQSKKEGYEGKHWTDPYIPAFNIKVQMTTNGEVKNYQRSVDFSTGVVSVKWTDNRGDFLRKLFVSRADNAVVLSISSTSKGKVSCTLKLAQQPPRGTGGWNPVGMHKDGIMEYSAKSESQWLTYRSSFKRACTGSLQGYEGVSQIVVKGGQTTNLDDKIVINDADEVLILTQMALLKNYENSQIEQLKSSLSKITPEFNALLERHTPAHATIFNRVRLDLNGGTDRNLSSEELLAKSSFGNLNPALLEKVFDAARYNILSSSGTDRFPNLQGIWTGTYGSPWSGDYTLNGNVECAIAANMSANMSENMEPFFIFMENHMDDFRLNAKRLYGCRGIHVPSKASINGLNNHFDGTWPMTFWTAGAGWASQFYYDYYLYTGDKEFLRKRALPFMRESALFYEDFLAKGNDGKLLFSPSYSPENDPGNSTSQASVNASMDIGVARELLNNCIAASKALGVGKDDIRHWSKMLKAMPDYLINEKGAVKEWSTPLLEDNDAHRHCSHLYALYYGIPAEIAKDKKLLKAFEVGMENRLNLRRREFMGESVNGRPPGEMAFGIVFQGFVGASLKKADDCGEIVDWLTNKYWNPNFVSTHNPGKVFNTDISGGLPALIIRMLVESQPGWVEFLPAWPKSMPSGKVEGIALRGQILLKELSWKDNQITATLNSEIYQKITLKMDGRIKSIELVNDKNIKEKSQISLPKNTDVKIKIELK